MTRRDTALALAVAVIWGVNFVAIHHTLEHYPPFFAVALRFTLLAIPTVLFVPRLTGSHGWVIIYGLGFGVVQFLFLYWAMAEGLPAGVASIIQQASAPMTVLLATAFLRERLRATQLAGVLVAALGLGAIALHRGQVATLAPVILGLVGALGWAIGNIATRQARAENPFVLMMWMTVIPPIPMLALSLAVEGPDRIGAAMASALSRPALPSGLGLLYTVVVATVLGSGLWASLMRRNPSSTVAPFSMLIPVAGLGSAWLMLGERPSLWDVIGGAVVMAGVWLTTTRVGPRRGAAAPCARAAAPSS